MSKYSSLMWKARKAMECSIRAESKWAKEYWHGVAYKLFAKAGDLTLEQANNED